MKSFIESTRDTESKMFWLNRWNTWMDVIKLYVLKIYKVIANIKISVIQFQLFQRINLWAIY